ncbi:MAG: ABC transporter permease [Pseudobdellovibrio sp.]
MFSVKHLLKFVFRDLFSQKKLNLFFIFNLALGFIGFLLLQIFQSSLDLQTQSKAQEILGGDVVISSRSLLSDETVLSIEQKVNLKYTAKAKSHEFFAMLKYKEEKSGTEQSRLVLVRAVSEDYPLYGSLETKNKIQDIQVEKINKIYSRNLYIDPELIDQLKIAPGVESVKLSLGDLKLDVTGVLVADPTRTFRLGALAPFIVISEKDLPKANLIKTGSTVTTNYFYKLNQPEMANQYKETLDKEYLDPTLRFSSAFQDDSENNRVFNYLIDYLGLVSLISIGLCFLCLSYMLNWFFQIQKKNIAIYKILGLEEKSVLFVQATKNLILSILSFGIALLIVYSCLPVLQEAMYNYFKVPVELIVSPVQILISFVVVIVGPQLIAVPTYYTATRVSSLILLRQELGQNRLLSQKFKFLWLGSLFVVFWGLAVWKSHSLQTGSVFIVSLFFAMMFAWILIFSVRNFISLIISQLSFENRYALLGLIRKPSSTDLIFMTMTLSIVVLTLLPHIKRSIIEEVRPSQSAIIPSLFMFDIQMDQKDELIQIVKNIISKDLELTPMVRSRILKINDQSYERLAESGLFKTREDENEARFRNRGVNLTYKAHLQDSEEITEGKWFHAGYNADHPDALPEISLEERYAERVGAKLNDIMIFDVQGLEIKAKVTSLRRVRWTSFQPNFFIVFQPGVLEEAPQNYLSSISQLDQNQMSSLQNAIVDKFANISIINVKQSVEKSLVFLDQMALALQVMATLALVVGFLIFIILINTQVGERLTEMNLLQVLGLDSDNIYQIFIRQFSFVAILSLIVGLFLGLIISYFIMSIVFKLGFYYDTGSMFIISFILVALTFTLLRLSIRPLVKSQPLALLKADGG